MTSTSPQLKPADLICGSGKNTEYSKIKARLNAILRYMSS